jgi:hypothetical protein
MTDDELSKALRQLTSPPMQARQLSEAEKDELIEKIGPKTARSILKTKGQVPAGRIPFLFSSIDPQAVLDVLANDVEAALTRALTKKAPSKQRLE